MDEKTRGYFTGIEPLTVLEEAYIKAKGMPCGSSVVGGHKDGSDFDVILSRGSFNSMKLDGKMCYTPFEYQGDGFRSFYVKGIDGRAINLIIPDNEEEDYKWRYAARETETICLREEHYRRAISGSKEVRVQEFEQLKEKGAEEYRRLSRRL